MLFVLRISTTSKEQKLKSKIGLSALTAIILFSLRSIGQIPPGYYDPVENLFGDTLRFELSKIIDGHQAQSYSSLWSHFSNTDKKSDGTVWDMYSDQPGGMPSYTFAFFSDQCGNYSGEGDCYNREHSFPRSWWGGSTGTPMYTDLFHVVPSDGYVNGRRGNLPYGETSNPNWTSSNGSKKGSSSFPGYSQEVFEPIDEYKGDFARGYFYMMTRYYNNISGWSSDMLSGNDLSSWAKDLLLQWHRSDTVSMKEINRNEEIYSIQQNRNPYIDHPAYVELIWGDSTINSIADLKQRERPKVLVTNGQISISSKNLESEYLLRIWNLQGKELLKRKIKGQESIFFRYSGPVIGSLKTKNQAFNYKLVIP